MKYIMIAKQFPAYHPKAGQPTGFRDSILTGRKIHTLRETAGGKVTGDTVSLREWAGRPYASQQIEFARCRVRVQEIGITPQWELNELASIADRDGFDCVRDFAAWFKCECWNIQFDGVRIWFQDVKPVAGKYAQCNPK